MWRTGRALVDEYRRRTDPIGHARRLGVQVGERCRLFAITGATFGSEPYLVRLGDDVTVTAGVRFVTHDGGVHVLRDEFPDVELFGAIDIGSRVFLGLDSIVLPGIRIGARCVVGAGSVVSRDVPEGTVVAGVPARPLCTIDQYREKAFREGTHLRGMAGPQKRAALEALFRPSASEPEAAEGMLP